MFSFLTVTLYIVAWAYLVRQTVKKEPFSAKTLLAIIGGGIVAHVFSVYYSVYSPEGVQLGIFKVSSLFFVVINAVVWLSSLKKPLHNLYLGLLPLSLMAVAISLFFSSPITKADALSPGILAHILLSILAYSLLTIATLQAVLLSYQNRKIRSKHPGSIMGLMPPLQTMETLLFELVWGGILFLTLSIVTGFLFVDDFMAQKLSHKAVFSIISWVIYATLLTGRHFMGWRGKIAIRWVVGGFIALMIAYFGSKLVLEVILSAN